MEKEQIKSLFKCMLWSVVWSVILFLSALVIVNFTEFILKDVLFIEGIIFIVLGILSSIGGSPIGTSLYSLGQNNAQYISGANIESLKRDNDMNNTNEQLKNTLRMSVSMVSLILAGIICIIINFII